MSPLKLIVTSKKKLQLKYGKRFSEIEESLNNLVKSDEKRNLKTVIVYIDDNESCKKAKIEAVNAITPFNCKKAINELHLNFMPAYTVILGAQDIIPFQQIKNLAEDEDVSFPSDFPYACDSPYSDEILNLIGPTRVIGRIPDIPASNDSTYLTNLIGNIEKHKPIDTEKYLDNYFAISTFEWRKATGKTVQNIFGNKDKLVIAPPNKGQHTKLQLNALIHYFNCNGNKSDPTYYGQKGGSYPVVLQSKDLISNIAYGTIVASACPFGTDLFYPTKTKTNGNIVESELGIANTYLKQGAVAFLGCNSISYGPADGQALSDLITQFFIKRVIQGSSTGRALLEAQQEFLSISGPTLDPYELKTVAQYYLLGDPSIQPATAPEDQELTSRKGNLIISRRIRLFHEGVRLMKMYRQQKRSDIET